MQSIDLDAGGDVGANNASKLNQVSGELPSPTVISQVDGNRTEAAPEWLTGRLVARSQTIADRVEKIREFVAANAEALSNAVNALRESDQLSATAADQATALIDDVTSGKALANAAATGATAGGFAGVSTSGSASTGAAGGAKDAFGG